MLSTDRWLRWVVVLFWCVACGDDTTKRARAISIVEGSAVADAAIDVVEEPASLAVCPIAPPMAGALCNTINDLVCEYGNATSPSCDSLFICYQPDPCSTQPPVWNQIGLTKACPTSEMGCPAAMSDVPDSGACQPTQSCTYVNGVCACDGVMRCWATKVACADLANRPRLGAVCSPDTPQVPLLPPVGFCPFELDSFQAPYSQVCNGYVCLNGTVMPRCYYDGPIGPPPPC